MLNNLNKTYFICILLCSLVKSQDVSISVGDVSTAGYTSNIPVPINLTSSNENIGGFQFDVSVTPAMINLTGVTTVGPATEFSADFSLLNNGNYRVIFYKGSNSEGLNADINTEVMALQFSGSNVLSAVLEIKLSNVIVSSDDGNILPAVFYNGDLTIGDVVGISGATATADVEETVNIDISVSNTADIGGIQFDIYDSPNYLNLVSVSTTDRSSGFEAEFNNLNNDDISRIILYSSNNNLIEAGSGPVLTATFEVISTAYADSVYLYMSDVIATDGIGGTYWISSSDSGTVVVYPGYIEEPSNLEAIDGQDAYVALSWDPPSGPIPDSFSEDFENGLPEDWTLTTNSSQGWLLTSDCSSQYWTVPSHTNYMCSNDDQANDDGSLDYLITPAFNVSGAASVILSFDSYFDGTYNQGASIGVSDNGTDFTEVYVLSPATEWITETIDLSSYISGNNMYILFHSNDNATWASGWAIDDVSISFETREIPDRVANYNLTDFGEWILNAPKDEIINSFGGGIPFADRIDLDNPNNYNIGRPVEIDAYKVYKSLNGLDGFEEIVELEGSITSYVDDNVENNTSYYYYVTAIYPDGSESSATNIVSATPVEWIEVNFSEGGSSLSGQTDTIEISLNNESLLGWFTFEIEDYPDVLVGESVLPTDRTTNWMLDIIEIDGKINITGFGPLAGAGPLEAGSGPVCRVVIRPQGDQALDVTLTMTDVQIQDLSSPPVQLNWTAELGTYEVGIETQYVMLTDGSAPSGGQMTSSMCLINTQPVYGIQVDFIADPPFIEGAGVQITDLLDLSSWSVSSQHVGFTYTVLLFDNTFNNPIPPGYWYLGEVLLDVVNGAPDGFVVDINYGDMVLSGAGNEQLVSQGLSSEVYVGAPPASYSIQNVEGLLSPGSQGSFEVHLANTQIVGIISFVLADVPEYLTVTSLEALGRFNGIIDGASGEDENNENFYFLGYDLSGMGDGIAIGEGPIVKVNVEMNQNIYNPNVMLLFEEVTAGDPDGNPITAASQGLGLFTNPMLSNDSENIMPSDYRLHSNYPNPFNPSTIITYDLAADGHVDLSIYNIIGKKVKTIVNQNETAGRKFTAWYGTDDVGNALSAGMYFYRLTAGGKVFTKKMVLMK